MAKHDNTGKEKKSSEEAPVEPQKDNRRVSEVTVGFGINDCPLWLYKEFTKDIKGQYGNLYWPKLLDWFRKAQTYDLLAEQGIIPVLQEEEDFETDDAEEQDGVQTLGGFHRYGRND